MGRRQKQWSCRRRNHRSQATRATSSSWQFPPRIATGNAITGCMAANNDEATFALDLNE
jgi:hypothetical protein